MSSFYDSLHSTADIANKTLRTLRPRLMDATSGAGGYLLTKAGLQTRTTFADKALLVGCGALAGGITDGASQLKDRASNLGGGASELIGKIQDSAGDAFGGALGGGSANGTANGTSNRGYANGRTASTRSPSGSGSGESIR